GTARLSAGSLPSLSVRGIADHAPDDALAIGPDAMRDASAAALAMTRRARDPAERLEAARAAHSVALDVGRPVEALRWVDSLAAAGATQWVTLRLPILAALYEDGDAFAGARAANALARALRESSSTPRRQDIAAMDDLDDDQATERER